MKREKEKKGKGKRLLRSLPDPKISVISYSTKRHKASPHRKAIAEIVAALHSSGRRNLNYDHVTISVPKSQVPLWINKRRFDISYKTSDSFILIDVFAFDLEDIEIMLRENGNSNPTDDI